MDNIKKMLLEAKKDGYAVGAFNIFNCISAKAVLQAAQENKSPLILQTSTKTVRTHGAKTLIEMLKILIQEVTIPVVIHMDHCIDIDLAKECIDAGWDSVMIDASSKPLEDNIRITQKVKNYASDKGVFVEGELGVIMGAEDNVFSDKEEKAGYDESIIYIKETQIDLFAPAVGTAHGLYSGKPEIDFDLVNKLDRNTNISIVIHGGTGLSDKTFHRLIKNGANKINVSTAIKHSYMDGISKFLNHNPDSYSPISLEKYVIDEVKEAAKKHMILFGCNNRI